MNETVTRKLICIECPRGCELTATVQDGAVTAVTGNFCAKGKRYAESECVAPRRVLTTTIRLTGGEMLSVKTDREILKDKLFEVMAAVNKVIASAPVSIGQVLADNIDGDGANLVATKDITETQINGK
jgi:CxxC motif-containing protein